MGTSFRPSPAEQEQEYHFWGVLNRYASGFEDILVDEMDCIGEGDTPEEIIEDVKFKLWDEINRLHSMGEPVPVYTKEEAENFAERNCEELRGDDESRVESWRLERITVDMNTPPPGLPQEELDAIEALMWESWAKCLAEAEKTQPKCSDT